MTHELTDLERAALICMEEAKSAKSVWVALVAQNCAIRIRKSPDWTVHRYLTRESSAIK